MTVIILHPEGRGKTAGSNAPGAFLVFFFGGGGHLPQTSLGETNMRCKLSVNINNVSSRLRSIR